MEYTFTGQASYMDDPITSETTEGFGLMFFNARWLDPAIGRFAQADSIVPSGVQGYDRYAYGNNNPIKYTDPTGHCPVCSTGVVTLTGGFTMVGIGLGAMILAPEVLAIAAGVAVITIVVIAADTVYDYATTPTANNISQPDLTNAVSNTDQQTDVTGIVTHLDAKNKPDIEFIKDLLRAHGLNPNSKTVRELIRRTLHDEITGERLSDEEIAAELEDIIRLKSKNKDKNTIEPE
jgi:RHS repeat-associated protein